MGVGPGRPADEMYRRTSYMLIALVRRPHGMTRHDLMALVGTDTKNESDRRKFERDLVKIRESGCVIEHARRTDKMIGDQDHYVLRVVDHRLRAGFSDDERAQLLRAAQRAGLGQLYQDLGAPTDGKYVKDAENGILSHIQQAILNRRRLRFDYSEKSRSVHPYDVFFRRSRWYFRGRENYSQDIKTWKVERVSDLAVGQPGSAEPLPKLPEPNLDPMLQQNHAPLTAVVRVDNTYLDEVVAMLGTAGHEVRSSGDPDTPSVEVNFVVTYQEAFLNRVFELGDRVQLIGPESLREVARATLTEIADGSDPAPDEPAPRGSTSVQSSIPFPLSVDAASVTAKPVVGSGPGGQLLPEITGYLQQTSGEASLEDLSRELGHDTEELRRHLAVLQDPAYLDRLEREDPNFYQLPMSIEPAGDEPSDRDLVVLKRDAGEYLGTELFDASVLGPLYVAAEQLSVEEPGNEELAAAAAKLQKRFLPAFREGSTFGSGLVQDLAVAIREGRAVRMTYARAWKPGVSERTIHPFQLVVASRGIEVDAEPAENPGEARSFLIGNIRDLRLLPERFELPADFDLICQKNRDTRILRGKVPLSRQWAIEKWSEAVSFGKASDGEIEFQAKVLPPYEHRIALMMIAAGPRAHIQGPRADRELAPTLAQRLLDLHRL